MLLRVALAVIGLAHLLFPRTLVDTCLARTTTAPRQVEPEPWVYSAVRTVGVLVLFLALVRRRSTAI